MEISSNLTSLKKVTIPNTVAVVVIIGGVAVSVVGSSMGVAADGVVVAGAAGGEHKDDTFNSSNHIITDGM